MGCYIFGVDRFLDHEPPRDCDGRGGDADVPGCEHRQMGVCRAGSVPLKIIVKTKHLLGMYSSWGSPPPTIYLCLHTLPPTFLSFSLTSCLSSCSPSCYPTCIYFLSTFLPTFASHPLYQPATQPHHRLYVTKPSHSHVWPCGRKYGGW